MNKNANVNNPKCGDNSACTLFTDPNKRERDATTKNKVRGESNSFLIQVIFFVNKNSPTEDKMRARAKKPTKYHLGVVKKSCVKGRKKTTTKKVNKYKT